MVQIIQSSLLKLYSQYIIMLYKGKGEIPSSWHEAITSIIPKYGKVYLECVSYTPITVLDIDYRVVHKFVAWNISLIIFQNSCV